MKKIHLRAGSASLADRILKSAFVAAAFLCVVTGSQAQISVTGGGTSAETFDIIPAVGNWSTKTLPGAAAAPESDATMDEFVNGSTNDFSTINAAVGNNAGNPPGTSATAQWSSAGFYLQTRPTGNAVTLLMATLHNDSGGDIVSMTVTYTLTLRNTAAIAAEVIPGQRVYYSLTGAAGSWAPLGDFGADAPVNTPQNISIPVDLSVNHWPGGTPMYLLFADDNSVPNEDAANGIDDFAIGNVVGGNIAAIVITNQPPATVSLPERGSATLTVGASGSPIAYTWFRNGTAIPGANTHNYTISSAVYPDDNGAQFYCVLSNSLTFVTSATTTLTVAQDTTAPTVVSVLGEADGVTVRVSFSEPMLVDTVGEFNFAVFPTGTDPGASPILVYGATLENGTNVVLTTDPRTPGQNYSLQVQDVADNSSRQNVIDPNPTIITNFAQNVLLIGFDLENVWSYNINEGSLDGTGWEQPAYDDSAWPTGPAGLGLDASANGVPINTPLAYAANGVVTYFRKHFTLPSPTNGVVLTLRDVVEDGAVYYLNGQLVFTNRMPAGPYTFATLASGAPDPTPITGPFNLSITNLHSGDNVLAVAVYQSSATSSDIEMAAELTARVTQFAGGPPVIGAQPQGRTVNEGQPLVLSVEADGALPLNFQWYKDGNLLPSQTSAILSIPAAVPSDAGSYTVVVANSINSVTSDPAVVTVNPDTTAPVFLSAVADTNLTNIVLTFGERLDAASAENVAHYDVHLTAGGGALTIEAAALNGTNVILTTSPRTQSQGYTIVLNNVHDTAVAQNPVTPGTLPVNCGIIILAPDATTLWRYNTASNNLDGIPWQTLGYDDSSWLTGLAGFTSPGDEFTTNGFEIQTTNMVAPSLGGPVTDYYRVPFNLPGSPVGATLHIVGVIDDGLVAYINGVEAGRLRVTNASPVSFTNLASTSSPETSNVHLPLDTVILTNLSGLISGSNLLAIELHQNATTSSDAVLSVQLVAGLQSFAPVVAQPRLHITRNESTGQITLSWSEAGYSLQEAAALSGNGPGTGWGPSARQNGVPFTPAPGDDTHFYRLLSN